MKNYLNLSLPQRLWVTKMATQVLWCQVKVVKMPMSEYENDGLAGKFILKVEYIAEETRT